MPTYNRKLYATAMGSSLKVLPYMLGNSSTGRSSGTQNMVTAKRKRKPNRNSFRSKLMAVTAAKHHTGTQAQAFTHDSIYSLNVTAGIVQGDLNSTRNGDSIHLAAIKIKGFFNAATAAGAYSYRILVGYTGEEYTNTSFSAAAIGDVELFLPNTTNSFRGTGIINPKAFTCLYDETIDVNSEVAAALSLKSYAFTVQLDKRFPYQASGSVLGKDKNLMIVVIGSVAGGSLGVTAAGGTTISFDCIFKDL